MLACVDAGNVKKAETPTSPIPTAPETAANIFVKRVMCASLSTGAAGVSAPNPKLPDKDVR